MFKGGKKICDGAVQRQRRGGFNPTFPEHYDSSFNSQSDERSSKQRERERERDLTATMAFVPSSSLVSHLFRAKNFYCNFQEIEQCLTTIHPEKTKSHNYLWTVSPSKSIFPSDAFFSCESKNFRENEICWS